MLKIVSVGAAYPTNNIDNALLSELQPGFSAEPLLTSSKITTRPTILSLDYLNSTGNIDVWESVKHLAQTPIELGMQATNQALERAGVGAEEIGLIIGETATPLQTTPSEAQRMGKGLGIKVPAYDVTSNSTSLIHYLHLLNSWKEESRPNYIFCASTNCPTQRTNYRQGIEGIYFGDAACALLVTSRKEGRFNLRDSHFKLELSDRDLMRFPLYQSSFIAPDALKLMTERMHNMLKLAIAKNGLDAAQIKFIGNQLDRSALIEVAGSCGVAPSNVLGNLETRGFSLSSASLSALSDSWDSFKRGDLLVVAEGGASFGVGYVVLERC